jgi:hypothetical protein
MNPDVKLVLLTAFGAVLGAWMLSWLANNTDVSTGTYGSYSNPVLN